ncbi:MAG: Transcription regulator TetR family [Rhizobium sp.]|nr:Transcription regulator TetR family [Rhizobium sp.]
MNEVDGKADAVTMTQPEPQGAGRPAAGEDPIKREQILDGALCVFMQMGFDAASMNDITREAGVSKGTLYVYFKNKEDLFVAIIERQKLRIFGRLQEILEKNLPVVETLHDFGMLFSTHMLSDRTVRGARMVIAVIDRMPQLANLFMVAGPNSGPAMLANYLQRQVDNGQLKEIEDPMMVGRQFGDLCLAGLFRPRLFGELTEPPTAERIERNVASAVRLFLNTYGV